MLSVLLSVIRSFLVFLLTFSLLYNILQGASLMAFHNLASLDVLGI